jgi:hypothetical protein
MVWDRIESAVRQRPELWLWMYHHWRFRPSQECVVENNQRDLTALDDCDKRPEVRRVA